METETKICQNCKNQFVIESADFDFYKKLDVPPPTFCPDCRLQRRLMWRGERCLYKRACDLCGKSIVAIYSADKPFKVYCRDCFHGDQWDPLANGMDLDFSKPFLEQFKELQMKTPRQFAFAFQNLNSDYANGAAFNKNCYLIFVSDHNEDLMYSYSSFNCRNSADLLSCGECELCYEDLMCNKCYRVLYSQDCASSQDLYFCKNCTGCSNLVGCVNLKNKQYCIFNEQYSKEDYLKKLAELKLDSQAGRNEVAEKAEKLWSEYPSKYIHGYQNTETVGDYVLNSKNCFRAFDSERLEDCKFVNHGHNTKDCYDAYVIVDNSQYSYEVVSAIALNNTKFSYCVWNDYDTEYSDSCENSHHLFGCVSLRKKEYCILNKQYSKEEYEALIPKVIAHMKAMPYKDAGGRTYGYGEYFPIDLCPFAYNESVAQEYFPLSAKEAREHGFAWKEPEEKEYKITLPSERIPESVKDIPETIVNEAIGCAHQGECAHGCTKAFRVIPAELELYKQLGVPIPNLCHNCRHFERWAKRNQITLYAGHCSCRGKTSGSYKNSSEHFHGDAPCPNEFQTTYDPSKGSIVYCEKCYQAELA